MKQTVLLWHGFPTRSKTRNGAPPPASWSGGFPGQVKRRSNPNFSFHASKSPQNSPSGADEKQGVL
ncbi:MAG: hypothetical protein J7576_21070, partial [Siphonobacter aquaeclarae]|nr:hypothetical protein [Siphonobacter aquaeclarae]